MTWSSSSSIFTLGRRAVRTLAQRQRRATPTSYTQPRNNRQERDGKGMEGEWGDWEAFFV